MDCVFYLAISNGAHIFIYTCFICKRKAKKASAEASPIELMNSCRMMWI